DTREVLLDASDGIALGGLGDLRVLSVRLGIVRCIVETHPIGHRLDQTGTLARERAIDSRLRGLIHGEQVVTIHEVTWETVPPRTRRERTSGRLLRPRR